MIACDRCERDYRRGQIEMRWICSHCMNRRQHSLREITYQMIIPVIAVTALVVSLGVAFA